MHLTWPDCRRCGAAWREIAGGALTLLAGAVAGSLTPATAATTTSNIAVSMTIQATCNVSTADMAFGTYQGAQLASTGSVTVICTNTTPYQIGIDSGQHAGTGNYAWRMAGPAGNFLSYQVFRDASHLQLWGGTQNVDTPSGTGTGNPQTFTAYGLIAGGQGPMPGGYGDTINLIIYY